jgi:catalase (peroxidase I)
MQMYTCNHRAANLRRSRTASKPAARRFVVRCAVNVEQLKAARHEVADLIKSKHCNPILVRLAWHDSGTYDKVCVTGAADSRLPASELMQDVLQTPA